MSRHLRLGVLALLAALAALLVATAGAFAAGGRVSPQYQGYGAPGGQDPYAGDNPRDVHVTGYGGQPGVTGYLKLNLDSLPSGSTIEGLQLQLVPNSSATDNANSGAAALEACPLTQPLSSNGYQANPPAYDCTQHSTGEAQADGSWRFELSSIASHWTQQNNGMAVLAYGADQTPAGSVSPSAWSIAFDHTKTSATVDYTAGQSSTASFFAQPAPQAAGSGTGGSPTLQALPAPKLPAEPVAPATGSAATGQTGAIGQSGGPTVVTQPKVQKQWIWLTVALVAAGLLMLAVGAGQHVLRTGKLQLGAALAASRSQLATPVAVLALAAVLALGSTSQLVTVVVPGRGVAGSGTAAAGGSGAGGAAGGAAAAQGAGGAAGGSSGTAGASAGGNTNGGQDGPGVTSNTVRVGFVYVTNAQAANQAFGLHVANQGNEQSEEQTLVDYVNKHGGIAGRQIQPVYVAVDNAQAQSNPNASENVCHTMTEDYHVFAVVAGSGPPDDAAANACYAQHGTINFDAGVTGGLDLQFLKQASPYIWANTDAALDRAVRWEVAGLQNRGFFGGAPGYKLGVVVAQDPVNERIYQQVTLPSLQAAGVSKPDEFEVPHDTISDIANNMKQAVIHFQADGVTNVIFQGGGNYGTGSYAILFMLDAESQHYTPRYGLTTQDGPVALAQNVPQDQLNKALSVGWAPGYDTDDAHSTAWPSSPAEKRCAQIEQAAGNTSSDGHRDGALAMMTLCDTLFLFQQAAQPLTGQPLNAQLWADQAMKLGSGFASAVLSSSYFGPDHWDGAGGYQLLHAVQNCEGSSACFEYDSSTIYH